MTLCGAISIGTDVGSLVCIVPADPLKAPDLLWSLRSSSPQLTLQVHTMKILIIIATFVICAIVGAGSLSDMTWAACCERQALPCSKTKTLKQCYAACNRGCNEEGDLANRKCRQYCDINFQVCY